MAISQEDLDSFYAFASDRIQKVGVESPEELFDLWKLLNPMPSEQSNIGSSAKFVGSWIYSQLPTNFDEEPTLLRANIKI